MVKSINVSLDDEVYEKIKSTKDQLDMTWPEFLEFAAEELRPNESKTVDTETVDVELDIPGSGELRDRRKKACVEMAELLRDRGTATKSDFLELVEPNEVGYSSAESFWSNCVKGRDSLRAIPGVKPPKDGLSEWSYSET